MRGLSAYKKNITSQNGEDGIIEEVFKRIGFKTKYCIEFGAWDGKYLSNVWNLWFNEGWNALLIEADEKKIEDLKSSIQKFEKVIAYQAFVQAEGESSIDEIVKKIQAPDEIDLLSIDIDGDDYYIFKSLKIKPRVVVVEYNSTIPPYVEIVQNKGEYLGSSALSMLKLAHQKKYKLAAITDTNLFFIKEEDFNLLGIEEVNIEVEFPTSHLVYVYSSFDGQNYIDKEPPYAFRGLKKYKDMLFESIQANPWLKRFIYKRLYVPYKERPKFESSIAKIPIKLFKD